MAPPAMCAWGALHRALTGFTCRYRYDGELAMECYTKAVRAALREAVRVLTQRERLPLPLPAHTHPAGHHLSQEADSTWLAC